jgi:hypothetical protein
MPYKCPQTTTGITSANLSRLYVNDPSVTNDARIGDLEILDDGLVELGGVAVNAFSTDGTFATNSDFKVPTEKAIKTYVTSAGSGYVTGPASAVDNGIVTFDSTTGKLVQDSGYTLEKYSTVMQLGANIGYSLGTKSVIVGDTIGGSGPPDRVVSVGYNNLTAMTSSGQSVAVGTGCGALGASILETVLIGTAAAYNASPAYSVCVGSDSCLGGSGGVVSFSNVVGVGYNALRDVEGDNNIGVGYRAADTLTTGTNTITIGSDADVAVATQSNSILIGNSTTVADAQIKIGDGNQTSVMFTPFTNSGYLKSDGSGNITDTDTPIEGPASSGDGTVPLFDGTTGKLLKDSAVPLSVPSTATIRMGNGANATGVDSVFIGKEVGAASGAIPNSVLIGREVCGSSASGGSAVCIGKNAGNNVNPSTCVFVGAGSGRNFTGALVSVAHCVGIGNAALYENHGDNNVAVGSNCCRLVTSGAQNTVCGSYACDATLTTGSNNIVMGYANDTATSSDSNCILLGNSTTVANAQIKIGDGNQTSVMITPFTNSGYLKSDGSGNITDTDTPVEGPASAVDNGIVTFDGTTGKLLKDSAVPLSVPSADTISMGNGANATGIDSVFVGKDVGAASGALPYSVLIGREACSDSASGTNAICLGKRAGSRVNPTQCTFIGNSAGRNNTGLVVSVADCIGIGNAALFENHGDNNVAVGSNCSRMITSGAQNTVCGSYACDATLTTGSNNIIMGYANDTAVSSDSNCILLGNSTTVANAQIKIGDGNQTSVMITPFTNTGYLKSDGSGNITDDSVVFGGAYVHNNGTATVSGVSSQDVALVADATIMTCGEGGITLKDGIQKAITAVADAGGAPNEVTLTVGAGHGFAQYDLLSVSGTTSYNGLYVIQSVATSTVNIVSAFVATETGRAHRPVQLTTSTTGCYEISAFMGVAAGSGGALTVEFHVIHGDHVDTATQYDEIHSRRRFTNTDEGSLSMSGFVTLSDATNDLGLIFNGDGTNDLTLSQLQFTMKKVW